MSCFGAVKRFSGEGGQKKDFGGREAGKFFEERACLYLFPQVRRRKE
jgi:hypothetical protein